MYIVSDILDKRVMICDLCHLNLFLFRLLALLEISSQITFFVETHQALSDCYVLGPKCRLIDP